MEQAYPVVKGAKWAFDDSVTHVFDDMLERSIPQYGLLRSLVTQVAMPFLIPGQTVIDLGCSRGGVIASMIETAPESTRFIGVDCSTPMAKAARTELARYGDRVQIEQMDLRSQFPQVADACAVVSMLTLQFTPIEYRQRIIGDVYKALMPGGAFILVEKVLGNSNATHELLVQLYHSLKGDNGYSFPEIERKRLSLEGVLVPVTAQWNQQLLTDAGFKDIDCFWRYLNFAGWIAIK